MPATHKSRWLEEQDDMLIELFMQAPILWDENHEDYRNPFRRRRELENLTKQLQVTHPNLASMYTSFRIVYLKLKSYKL